MLHLIPYQDIGQHLEDLLAADSRLASPHTRQAYRLALTQFDVWREGRPFGKLTVEEYLAALQERGMSPTTINQKLSALRWYARRLTDHVYELKPQKGEHPGMFEMFRDQMILHLTRITRIPDVKGARVRSGRSIGEGEYSALLQRLRG
jgi:hypothetical protein